jgi:hypothetical protein
VKDKGRGKIKGEFKIKKVKYFQKEQYKGRRCLTQI